MLNVFPDGIQIRLNAFSCYLEARCLERLPNVQSLGILHMGISREIHLVMAAEFPDRSALLAGASDPLRHLCALTPEFQCKFCARHDYGVTYHHYWPLAATTPRAGHFFKKMNTCRPLRTTTDNGESIKAEKTLGIMNKNYYQFVDPFFEFVGPTKKRRRAWHVKSCTLVKMPISGSFTEIRWQNGSANSLKVLFHSSSVRDWNA